MCNLMHTQSTWMTCDCSANKHWVHVYYVPQKNDFLTGQCWHRNDLWLGRRLCSINKQWASLSLSTHTHTHTSEEWLVTVQYQQTVSAHVPEKNDLWLCSINKRWVHMYLRRMTCDCSINKQWVYMYLRRMTCDCAVSTSSEYTCTWEEWLVTVQYQQSVSAHVPEKNDLWLGSVSMVRHSPIDQVTQERGLTASMEQCMWWPWASVTWVDAH